MTPWDMLQRAAMSQLYNTRHTVRRVKTVELVVKPRATVTLHQDADARSNEFKETISALQREKSYGTMVARCCRVMRLLKKGPTPARELRKRLKFGRTVLRECLRLLEEQGKAERTGGGAFIVWRPCGPIKGCD